MGIPIASTMLQVRRQEELVAEVDADSETDYSPDMAGWRTIARGVRAVIKAPQGQRQFGAAGELERVTFKFDCDPLPNGKTIQGDDQLVDSHGQVYVVDWARQRGGFGISFVEGEVYQQTGER